MGGLGTGSGIAYGGCGRRNLNGKGKTLSVSELKRVLPMHGFPERFSHLVRNECLGDIQAKEPQRGWVGRMLAWLKDRGGWAIAQSPILGTTITIQRLKKRLYESLLDVYFRINPSLYEPP